MAGRKKIKLIPDSVNKPSGLKTDGTPNVHWERFTERLKSFSFKSPTEWSEEDILGYLLDRYSKCFGMEWSLSYSGPPTKCPEMYIIRRMLTTVGTQKGTIAKQYIDWVFDSEIIPKKKQITSIAYFFNVGLCNQFKANFKKASTITRTTELPNEYVNHAASLGLTVFTYGDLAFAKQAIDCNPDESLNQYVELFSRLEQDGFDKEILNQLG